jgi:hypothetical protein
MSFLVLPVRVSLFHWGNSLKRSLVNLSVPTPPHDLSKWREWANLLLSINGLSYLPTPNKRMFPKDEDWEKWAWLFIKNYNLK